MKHKLLFIILPFILSSCFIVKYDNDVQKEKPIIEVSTKPSVRMSETIVRSEIGDMIALLPEDWYFIDFEGDVNKDIYAVATSPQYNLSLVFSKIDGNRDLINLGEEQLKKLASRVLDKRVKKSSGRVEQIGKFHQINIAQKKFMSFDISTTGGALLTNVAVFKSELDNFYEIALIPMNILGQSIPNEKQKNKIFNSVLATVKY